MLLSMLLSAIGWQMPPTWPHLHGCRVENTQISFSWQSKFSKRWRFHVNACSMYIDKQTRHDRKFRGSLSNQQKAFPLQSTQFRMWDTHVSTQGCVSTLNIHMSPNTPRLKIRGVVVQPKNKAIPRQSNLRS